MCVPPHKTFQPKPSAHITIASHGSQLDWNNFVRPGKMLTEKWTEPFISRLGTHWQRRSEWLKESTLKNYFQLNILISCASVERTAHTTGDHPCPPWLMTSILSLLQVWEEHLHISHHTSGNTSHKLYSTYNFWRGYETALLQTGHQTMSSLLCAKQLAPISYRSLELCEVPSCFKYFTITGLNDWIQYPWSLVISATSIGPPKEYYGC